MNQLSLPVAPNLPAVLAPPRPLPAAAFQSLRALTPRAPMFRPVATRMPATPLHETRAFPIELTYMS